MSSGTPLQEPAQVPALKLEPLLPLSVSQGIFVFSLRTELGPLAFLLPEGSPGALGNMMLSCVLIVIQLDPSLLFWGLSSAPFGRGEVLDQIENLLLGAPCVEVHGVETRDRSNGRAS